ncbi:unnamed protein product [Prorocentrum cordatum]|uniref:Uncharacterized protein n=1 Tax=Prorocentrum cordatum TaxID=2364126 RepID=A0ABN9SWN3_9DINO|nr:unnamed protein product [Polarella glacialis]
MDDPPPDTQNRVLAAWEERPPERVAEYFVKVRSTGTPLSKRAYRSIVVAYERSDPTFVLKIDKEMKRPGIHFKRTAQNAGLGIHCKVGMHNEGHDLLMNIMAS